jgi:hypothetical protein
MIKKPSCVCSAGGFRFFVRLALPCRSDTVIQIQTEYAKTAHADFVAQATKMGELHSNLAKAAFSRLNR